MISLLMMVVLATRRLTKLAALIVFLVLFLIQPHVYAQDKPEAIPSATSQAVSSYDLFWPIVAGKTEADSFYFLKLYREDVVGWFIFSDSKKADYAILLGTKRVLEAEKLIGDGKIGLASRALDKASAQFTSAYDYLKKADGKGKLSTKEIRRDRVVNVKILIDEVKKTAPGDVQNKLEIVKEKAHALLADYLASV